MERDKMGQIVTVTKRFERVYRGDSRKWKVTSQEPARGWIVGFRTIWDGYMDSDTDDYGRVEATYFVHDGHHKCALVSFSPRQNPVNVPMDGFELAPAALAAAGGE